MSSSVASSHIDYITRLRFPLAVGIVFIHCAGIMPIWSQWTQLSLLQSLKWWLSSALPAPVVSVFFVISGFLFFRNYPHRWSWELYVDKLLRRSRTLLIPYLFWNVLKFLTLWGENGGQAFHKFFFREGGFNLFWGVHSIGTDSYGFCALPLGHLTTPVDVPLWFLRDLIIVVLVTPLLYMLLCRPRRAAISLLLMTCAYLLKAWPYVGGISCASVFYFSWGAFVALSGRDLLRVLRPVREFSYICFGGLMTLQFFGKPLLSGYLLQTVNVCALWSGIAAYINLSADMGKWLPRLRRWESWLATAGFTIYAAHTVGILEWTDKALLRLFSNNGGFAGVLHYLLLPTTAVATCLLLFAILQWLPFSLGAWLTGNFKRKTPHIRHTR